MTQNIVIYQDEGTSGFAVSCLQELFKDDRVSLSDAEAVKHGAIFQNADIFVMPGGADLPYCRKLNGKGNANIRAFVENGGTYFGSCAGAYYACASVEFHKERPDEISGTRELSFVHSTAYGSLPAIAPYYDSTIKTAALAKVALNGKTSFMLYHGGPAFRLNDHANIIGVYEDLPGKPPAIVEKGVGKGRVLLCGLHPEMTADNMPRHPVVNKDEENFLNTLIAKMTEKQEDTRGILRSLLRKK